MVKEVFCEINKNHPSNEDKFNKLFATYDANSDKKLSREEFGKAVEMFLEPVYL